MDITTEEKRAQELITQYNAYQDPEEVIHEMAYRIAQLEDELDKEKKYSSDMSWTLNPDRMGS